MLSASYTLLAINVTFPNSSIKFNSSIGWINIRSRIDLIVYRSAFSWWFLYRTITLQITAYLPGTISLTMPYWQLLLSTPSCFKNNATPRIFMSWSRENHSEWFVSLGRWAINQVSNHELKIFLVFFKILSGLLVTSIAAAGLQWLFLPNWSKSIWC